MGCGKMWNMFSQTKEENIELGSPNCHYLISENIDDNPLTFGKSTLAAYSGQG
jgi:hypothetical protein